MLATLLCFSLARAATPPSVPPPSAAAKPAAVRDVAALIRRTEEQSIGKTFRGRLKMTVERDGGNRVHEILSWTDGRDKALVKVLSPAKDRGVAHLRLELNLTQYLPKVERTIKVPPSLMLQSWMGSDFTNDDLVKTSRLTRDYDCTFDANEVVDDVKVDRVTCRPKPEAPVVWGKLELWIDPRRAVLMRQDFFTENGERVKQLIGRDVKVLDGHDVASRLVMTTFKKKTVTTLEYLEAHFDHPLDPKIFTPANLEAPLKND